MLVSVGKLGNNIFFSFTLFDFKMLPWETSYLNTNVSILNFKVILCKEN